MSGKLSSSAQMRLATLQQVTERLHHVHGLVERYATSREAAQAEPYIQPMKRAFGRLKVELTGLGLEVMGQQAGALELAAGRTASLQMKRRILREGVASLRFQLDYEQRRVISDDQAAQATARREQEDRSPDGPES